MGRTAVLRERAAAQRAYARAGRRGARPARCAWAGLPPGPLLPPPLLVLPGPCPAGGRGCPCARRADGALLGVCHVPPHVLSVVPAQGLRAARIGAVAGPAGRRRERPAALPALDDPRPADLSVGLGPTVLAEGVSRMAAMLERAAAQRACRGHRHCAAPRAPCYKIGRGAPRAHRGRHAAPCAPSPAAPPPLPGGDHGLKPSAPAGSAPHARRLVRPPRNRTRAPFRSPRARRRCSARAPRPSAQCIRLCGPQARRILLCRLCLHGGQCDGGRVAVPRGLLAHP